MIIELYVYRSAQFQYSAFEAKKKKMFLTLLKLSLAIFLLLWF